MMTALMILVAVFLIFALIGVVCQIFGGGFFAIFHLLNGTVGLLVELLFEVLAAILKGILEG
jgi:hypothetical protein